ncbi:DUF4433 domain-containing protein [Campylobacter geochelonis]|uniref:DUF4433 domain-containing protein n=1 Tax=Campylobacter geochelonis TaxID=1780362 RepID=UPI000770B535|nr:DUF4433 domain-containing protein [Campylobacter geochelonis]CZE46269.1 Uncharacterised protein [Campylobacter geochelonis]CZE50711.1 Uncharacterised protein [Campylobacter geochelonis]
MKANLNQLNKINYLSHMTSLQNLENILKYGLQNHYTKYKVTDISNTEVNARREVKENIYGHKIHEYVPFYFNPRNAMLYRNRYEDDVIILGFSVMIVKANKVLFSNKNASKRDVKFTKNLSDLVDEEFINFKDVFSTSWCNNHIRNEELKAVMMAEALVYKSVDISNLRFIICKDKSTADKINAKFRLKGIKVIIDSSKFF